MAIIENLRDIVSESVKPLENIDGIKIIKVDGLTGGGGNGAVQGAGGNENLAHQVVSSALQYRTQAPLIDALIKEIGLSGGDLESLVQVAKDGLIEGVGANGDGEAATAAAETAVESAPAAKPQAPAKPAPKAPAQPKKPS
jgi:hypothetical protein